VQSIGIMNQALIALGSPSTQSTYLSNLSNLRNSPEYPLYSLPSRVKSPCSLLYSGNPPPSSAVLLPCRDRRLKPIPTPPCDSPVLRPTLCEALFRGCIPYLGIVLPRRVSPSHFERGSPAISVVIRGLRGRLVGLDS